jgi:hypothetical protein
MTAKRKSRDERKREPTKRDALKGALSPGAEGGSRGVTSEDPRVREDNKEDKS